MVLINRGWVPAIIKEQGGRPEGQVSGTVTIVGFLAPNDPGFPVKVGGVPIFGTCTRPLKVMRNEFHALITHTPMVQSNKIYQRRTPG
jgi:hypothetical protein